MQGTPCRHLPIRMPATTGARPSQSPTPNAGHAMPMATPAPAVDPHAGHNMGAATPAADPHAGHNMAAAGTGDTIGNAPAPAPPTDHAADAVWGAANIAASPDR